MTNIVSFAEHYFVQCVAKERAEDLVESILSDPDKPVLTEARIHKMRSELTKLFYQREKQKFIGSGV